MGCDNIFEAYIWRVLIQKCLTFFPISNWYNLLLLPMCIESPLLLTMSQVKLLQHQSLSFVLKYLLD